MVREHTVDVTTGPEPGAGPERWPDVRPERQYCRRRAEATKTPSAVLMLENIRVCVSDSHNRLQILREASLGETLTAYEQKDGQ